MIDLRKIRDSRPELTNAKLGELLFSDHKHPEMAVARVMSGRTELSTSQIETLAAFLGVRPGDLFTTEERKGWLDTSGTGDQIVLTKGDYTAVYNSKQAKSTLFYKGKPINEAILSGGCLVSEYLDLLDKAIANFEDNEEDLS